MWPGGKLWEASAVSSHRKTMFEDPADDQRKARVAIEQRFQCAVACEHSMKLPLSHEIPDSVDVLVSSEIDIAIP